MQRSEGAKATSMYGSVIRGNVSRIRMGDRRVVEEGQIEAIREGCEEGGLYGEEGRCGLQMLPSKPFNSFDGGPSPINALA